MKKLLHKAVLERRLVCDGAMGTQLMLAGLEPGGCGELWNLTHRERILEIQRRYVQAGADCLITNTFGASRTMLERHGQADKVHAINHAGVSIAREAFGDTDGYVLGDIGPLGAILEPYGDFPQETAQRSMKSKRVLWSKPEPMRSSSKHKHRWKNLASPSKRHERQERHASSLRSRTTSLRTKLFT